MRELVHQRVIALRDDDNVLYDRARVYAEPERGGTWAGYIEFLASDGKAAVVSTRETTQSGLMDVAYWATGLEPIYFEGALALSAVLVAVSAAILLTAKLVGGWDAADQR